MAGEILKSLRHVWVTLEPLNLPMAVMGGLALATWKHVRATKDVDLLLETDTRGMTRVAEVLEAAGVRRRPRSPAIRLGQLELIRFVYEPVESFIQLEIDLLFAQSDYHRMAIQRRIVAQLPELDVPIAVLACEDLILHKLLAGRLIDRADAAALLRANRLSIDSGYLTTWAERLGLVAELEEVRQEAFPANSGPPTNA